MANTQFNNPWNRISLADYEGHMGADNVLQLQTLSRITREQLECGASSVAVLGCAGGNGLEHIGADVARVYAIDVNPAYLEQCRARHARLGRVLETVCMDLCAEDAVLPACGLLICNLIVEYLGTEAFCALLERSRGGLGIVSCVVQRNNGASFVSQTPEAERLAALDTLHRDICPDALGEGMRALGMKRILHRVYPLPNGKEFVRLDFATDP